MNSEARTVELSHDNFYAALETFLRSMKEIRNEENVTLVMDWDTPRHNRNVLIKIEPQEDKANQTTVH